MLKLSEANRNASAIKSLSPLKVRRQGSDMKPGFVKKLTPYPDAVASQMMDEEPSPVTDHLKAVKVVAHEKRASSAVPHAERKV